MRPRVVLLQDTVELRRLFLTHRLWRYQLFTSAAFAEFAVQAERQAHSSDEVGVYEQAHRALPLTANVVQSGLKYVKTEVRIARKELNSVQALVRSLDAKVERPLGFRARVTVGKSSETTN